MSSVLFLAILYSGFLAGCRKKEEATAPAAALQAQPGAAGLRILSVTPKGPTASSRESESIVVIFDRPMTALESLPEGRGPSLLKIEPPEPGKTRWLGSKTLAFTPERHLPYATSVKVTIPAGTRALDGASLKEDFTWSLETIRPRLVRHFPRDAQKWLKPDTRVLLVFNQPVDRAKGTDHISLTGAGDKGDEKKWGFRLTHPSAEALKQEDLEVPPEFALLMEPRPRLEPEMTYEVRVKEGFLPKEGPLGLEETQSFSFETYREFALAGLEKTENLSPDEPLEFQFTNPVPYKNVAAHVHFEPALEIPDYYSSWDQSNDTIWLNLPGQPETKYSGWLDADLADEFGNTLGRKVDFTFTTGPYPPSVNMTTGYGVLEAYAEPRYPVSVMNAEAAVFQAARVGKEGLIPLLKNPKLFWPNQKYAAPPGFFTLEKEIRFKTFRNKRSVVPLELSPLVPEKYGWLFLQIDPGRPKDEHERFLKVCVQITELGVSAKFSPENNVIWVTELKTGLPVPDAAVEIRDDGNRVKWSGRTDAAGRAASPGWRALGMTSREEWMEPQQWVFVTRGRDTAFASSEWGTGIDPYRFGISYEWFPRPSAVQGYVFTERGIYRAGEDVHIKAIIRRSEGGRWAVPAAGGRLSFEIQDPFQKSVHKGEAALDEFGSLAFDFGAPPDASLGYYGIMVKVPPQAPGEKEATLSGTFRVEAFRPAEFEVLLRTQDPAYVFGQEYQGEVRGRYLYGGGMGGQPVSWHLRFDRTSFSPPGFKGYVFGNEMAWGDEEEDNPSRLAASGVGPLDPEGKSSVRLPLRPEKEKDSILATLEATVSSPSRRSIANRIQTLVHRGEYYIGLKPATSFLERGKPLAVEVAAADPQGAPQAGKKIQVKLVRREWRSVRKAGVGGRFRWLTQKEDTEVSSQDVVTGSAPATATFTPDKSGFYFLLASGADARGNAITTTTSFYVTGRDYVPWERRDDDSIELVPDAESYRPGGEARILVKSPYEKAKALVTVERELVLESRVIDVEGTSNEIAVPIKPEYIPNVFVSVLLVQGRSAVGPPGDHQDLGQPSFKIGYVGLSVDPVEKRLAVEVIKDKERYRPKEEVTLNFKVKDAAGQGRRASLAVAVADAGVLNLIGYQTPDPFSEFYGQRPLSVRTSESLIHIIGQREYGEKGEEPGGGGEEGAPAPPLSLSESEIRGDFRATPFWNPSLITDDNGEARVSFTLPDNLTTFRIMAVAQTRDSEFGRGETSFRVSKKLMLQAALPRFVRAGDAFSGGVVIHNFTDKRGAALLSARVTGVRSGDGPLERNVPLGPGESREVRFSFEAPEPGAAAFVFQAKMDDLTDGLEAEIPVHLPRPTETVASFGETRDSARERISIPENVFPGKTALEVGASASALLGLKGTVEALTDYPYLCLEQRLSALLPFILAERIIVDFRLSPWSREEIRRYVEKGLRDLWSYQKDGLGLSLWPDSGQVSPFLTCYAALAVIRASEAGYPVNRNGLDRALQYLKNFLHWDWPAGNSFWAESEWKTTRAFALYVLALAGQPQTGYHEKLFAERSDLTLFGRALLLKALHLGKGPAEARETLLQELLNKMQVTPETAHFEDEVPPGGGRIYASNLRTSAIVLQALLETGTDHPLLPAMARWLTKKLASGTALTTQENFYAFYALSDYYSKKEPEPADFQARISLAGKTLIEAAFRGADAAPRSARVDLSESGPAGGPALELAAEKTGQGTLHYGTRLTYAPKAAREPRDEGIAVMKRIESPDGRPLEAIPAGSLVVVTLEIAVPRESLFVVVDDPLPAGLEAVNPAFVTESEKDLKKLEEVEPDSGKRWWEGFGHVEMRDDRVLLFADSLRPGIHVHRYLARALTAGVFGQPGTKAEQMYAPEVFGRSAEKSITIGR
ncbi:MAG: hypothetical protein A2W03_09140 [Candidatus Aminicenantes bacterium RBG_16_63_16]|nr:MAG: hypothetical protein A2W03_09140 [Candidatus Aminicenantes bacterium RBG_16_63_16]